MSIIYHQTTRREIIKISAALIATSYSFPSLSNSPTKSNTEIENREIINLLKFGDDYFIDKVEPEIWSIHARLISIGKYRKQSIPVTIEVATDPSFAQIVYSDKVESGKDGNYAIKYIYKSDYPGTNLFIRLTAEKEVGVFNKSTNSYDHVIQKIHSETKNLPAWM